MLVYGLLVYCYTMWYLVYDYELCYINAIYTILFVIYTIHYLNYLRTVYMLVSYAAVVDRDPW
jgi:hypothetical protein